MNASIVRAFGAWKNTGALLPPVPASPPRPRPRVLLVDRPGSVQSTVVSGRPGPAVSDADWYDVLVANTVYADAFGSRLVKNIREEKGYTYSPLRRFLYAPRREPSPDAGRRP
ncbi:MAG: insulinase family protein [Holophagales bacterium]|nr:insulinase family protein [Holophagales bacterium]